MIRWTVADDPIEYPLLLSAAYPSNQINIYPLLTFQQSLTTYILCFVQLLRIYFNAAESSRRTVCNIIVEF